MKFTQEKKIIYISFIRSLLVKKTKNRPTETLRWGCRGSQRPKTCFYHFIQSHVVTFQEKKWKHSHNFQLLIPSLRNMFEAISNPDFWISAQKKYHRPSKMAFFIFGNCSKNDIYSAISPKICSNTKIAVRDGKPLPNT